MNDEHFQDYESRYKWKGKLQLDYCSALGGEYEKHQVLFIFDKNDLQGRDTNHFAQNATSLPLSLLTGLVRQVSYRRTHASYFSSFLFVSCDKSWNSQL